MRSYVFLTGLAVLVSAGVKAQNARQKFNFNPEWKLKVFDDSTARRADYADNDWKQVSLPYAWNQEEAFLKAIDKLSTGVCWYRKHFTLSADTKDRKVFLEFEGARFGAEIWVNGKYVGLHENGVMAFGLDISAFLNPPGTENVVAVRTDNSWNYHEKATGSTWQWNNNNFNANYGGLPKNIWLHVSGPVYQTLPLYSTLGTKGVYIYASDIDIPAKKALINVESEVKNESGLVQNVNLDVSIFDASGKKIANFSSPAQNIQPGEKTTLTSSAPLNNLKFWSWGYGYLYTVVSALKIDGKVIDELRTSTGFRKTEFKNGMVYLNDRVLQMKGYAQRTSNEWPAVGMSVPAWLSDFSNKLMLESNANLVRWMHVTPWKQDVESCDRMGLIQAMPAGDAEKDVEGRRWTQREELMRDAIIYNRNNPSILFYESGNESISEPHMVAMKKIRDEFDPHGGRAIGSREMLDSPNSEYGGEMLYINKSSTQPLWAMEYSRDEAMRRYWDEYTFPYHKNGAGPLYRGQDASDYNRNMDSQAIEDVIRWHDYWEARPGTGERVSSGGVNIVFSDTNTHFRGESNYRVSGEVDAMRIPKDAFYAHQVMWNGWVNPDPKGLHIIGHWNYKPGTQKDIYVVSAAEKVQLFLNNKSMGWAKRDYNFLFTFPKVKWASGELKAVSYDAAGKVLNSKILRTVGAPSQIRLTLHQSSAGFKADNADMVLVDVEVLDAQGRRCPEAFNKIKFTLNGPAYWLGGIAHGPDNHIRSTELPVEGGVNRVLIRSLATAGTIRLKAEGEGLKTAELSFSSAPVIVQNGLAKEFPGDKLPLNLDRGETPAGASFKMLRKALHVKQAVAGAHQERVQSSYDNNELSDWVNDGKLQNAWVEYELTEPALVSEVCLKLNGFRSRQFPLLISIDGKVVFKGVTPKSLGYVTLKLKPVRGQKVKVQLTEASNVSDTRQMAEMNGKNLDDGNSSSLRSSGSLGIIEAEFYSPAGI